MGKINLLLENFNNKQNYVWVFSWEVISCKLSSPKVWQYWWQLLFSGEFSANRPTHSLQQWTSKKARNGRTSVGGSRSEKGLIKINL